LLQKPKNKIMKPAQFITFEGGEGAGKSTQIQRLAAHLQDKNQDVIVTREPGGSPKAEYLREILLSGAVKPLGVLAETLMFAAARADHVDVRIRPALEAGKWVLCDRFYDSTRAYQGTSSDLNPTVIVQLERITVDGIRPNLTFILDLPAEVGLARAQARAEQQAQKLALHDAKTPPTADRFESENIDFHTRLRAAFLAIAKTEPQRCVVVDALMSVEDVAQAIWQEVQKRYF
jgi:dTMP kinase